MRYASGYLFKFALCYGVFVQILGMRPDICLGLHWGYLFRYEACGRISVQVYIGGICSDMRYAAIYLFRFALCYGVFVYSVIKKLNGCSGMILDVVEMVEETRERKR